MFNLKEIDLFVFRGFGADTSTEVKRIMIIATGGGISVAVLTMAVYMIVQTAKEIKNIEVMTRLKRWQICHLFL